MPRRNKIIDALRADTALPFRNWWQQAPRFGESAPIPRFPSSGFGDHVLLAPRPVVCDGKAGGPSHRSRCTKYSTDRAAAKCEVRLALTKTARDRPLVHALGNTASGDFRHASSSRSSARRYLPLADHRSSNQIRPMRHSCPGWWLRGSVSSTVSGPTGPASPWSLISREKRRCTSSRIMRK